MYGIKKVSNLIFLHMYKYSIISDCEDRDCKKEINV